MLAAVMVACAFVASTAVAGTRSVASTRYDASSGAVVDPSLVAAAKANPTGKFDVIIQSTSRTAVTSLITSQRQKGQLRQQYRHLGAFNVTLPGMAITFVATYPNFFGKITISPNAKVALTDQSGPDDWQETIKADQLWSQPATTCAVDAVSGDQVDPTCVPEAAKPAPQAPAIAIVDSGIDSKLVDFGTRVVARQDFSGDTTPGLDPEGHGTMVAAVAAGASSVAPGVAQNAPLVDARVADGHGGAQVSNILSALDWILQNKSTFHIGVVNLSLAGNSEASMLYDPLDQAVEKLWLNGLVVVAAAGNNGSADGAVKMAAPGNDPFVITVGATDTNGTPNDPSDDFRAPWSAYGHTADGFAKPELSAPGRFIVGPVSSGSYLFSQVPDRQVAPGYMWMSGTSFAAPAVAGVAAQLLALHPDWTPDQVKGALMWSANGINSDGTGMGEVNAARAATVTTPPNPNENLNAFVSTDPTTGLNVFDSNAWKTEVSTNSLWTSSLWTSSLWTSSLWTSSLWTSSAWSASLWTSSLWTSSLWTSSLWTSSLWVS